jgi:hypothetical protein
MLSCHQFAADDSYILRLHSHTYSKWRRNKTKTLILSIKLTFQTRIKWYYKQMKLYKNILHSERVISSLCHVILYVGTSISEEPTACIIRVHVRRFASVMCHHSDVIPSVEKWSFTFSNTTRYVPPDLTKQNSTFFPQRAICVYYDSVVPLR